ncbi:diaminopimelate epimerase [Methanobrevibacter sp. DSM 116169]|uniref:diaminopimelate epimerase n=1 Tax=Methanobrevibacter sp. DSM 116169 TaxID=3242727 RepID=UPI0038FCBFFC
MDLKGIKFGKLHGLGNDYVIIDESKGEIIPEDEKAEVCRFLGDRHFGVGSDGILFVYPSDEADIGYRMFNPDGSEAEMCGNGIRCFGKFIYTKGIIKKDKIAIQTKDGIKNMDITIENGEPVLFKVDMGLSRFDTSKIPMKSEKQEFLNEDFEINGETFKLSAVNVGNPHAIIIVDDVDSIDINEYGPIVECDVKFPEKINVHFVEINSKDEARMITWERGAGVTLACGTGATGTAIVAYKLGLLNKNILLHLPGGDLIFNIYEKDGKIGAFMEGPAEYVFNGEF